jgi:hypothetical protein
MRKTSVSVMYRENCGGILRNLACGFRKAMDTLAELDLYDDLRERIFKQDTTANMEQKAKIPGMIAVK